MFKQSALESYRRRILVEANLTGCGILIAAAGVPASIFSHEAAQYMWTSGGGAAVIGGLILAKNLSNLNRFIPFDDDPFDPDDPEDPERESFEQDNSVTPETLVRFERPILPEHESEQAA